MSKYAQVFGQYLDLCRQVEGRRAAAPLIARLNKAGAEALGRIAGKYRPDPMAVPQTRPDSLFAPDYGVNLMRVDLPVDGAAAFRCGVPNLNSYVGIVANDAFHPTHSLQSLPEGLTVCSLSAVPEHLVEKVINILIHIVDNSVETGDPTEALNALLLSDGILIHAAAGVKLDKAVQIVNISNPATPMLAPRRVVVIAEDDAGLKVLLCDHSQAPTVEHLSVECVSVDAAKGSSIEIYDIEEGQASSRRAWRLNARQADSSRLSVATAFLQGGISGNGFHVECTGDRTHTSLSGLAICACGQVVDNSVTLVHKGLHGTSRQNFKSALYDDARGGFGGKIVVAPGAMFTDAAQSNKNLIIGDDARMSTAPQLEIYCDEVKCSHGATTGSLDDRAMFYMQSRGIPAEEARRMLTQSFMSDVVDSISFEVLRQRMHVLVEKRLSGAAASCDTCATACGSQPLNTEL